MALPKTFTGGERLFASDLNDNFEGLDTRLSSAEVNKIEIPFATVGSDTITLTMDNNRVLTRTASGNITFSGSSYTAGNSATVRVVAGASERTLTFPSSWVWVSVKPTALAANETGILTITCFGSTESDVVAAWAWSG